VAAARALDNPRQLGTAFNALAQLDRMEGRLDAAEANYQQSLALARSVGDPYLIAVVLLNLAMVVVSRADDEAARSMLQEVAQIADDNDSRPAALGAMDVSTGLAAHQGDWQRVAHYHGLTGAQYAQAGIQRDAPDEAFLEPMVERARQAMGGQAFDAAAEAARGAPFDPAWQALRGWLAGAPAAPDINRSRPADPAA
jgi:tetratricopeptide (TPR) repeat protein